MESNLVSMNPRKGRPISLSLFTWLLNSEAILLAHWNPTTIHRTMWPNKANRMMMRGMKPVWRCQRLSQGLTDRQHEGGLSLHTVTTQHTRSNLNSKWEYQGIVDLHQSWAPTGCTWLWPLTQSGGRRFHHLCVWMSHWLRWSPPLLLPLLI